jgi:ribonucleoside-triphosphate reductase (formate)
MDVVKRNSLIVPYDQAKIVNAIKKAGHVREATIKKIVSEIESKLTDNRLSVEEIQDMVETGLMESSYKNVAREYIRYRKEREIIRSSDEAYASILKLLDNKNEYIKTENSNKNASIASTQRDYIAGEVSKALSKKLLLPKRVVEAHERGALHFHDMDYYVQHIHNCCLVNLEDILQHGTVINGTLIETPHSFSTACNIATQVAAIVASNQYGGQTMSLAHLAPFVDVSRQRLKKQFPEELVEPLLKEEVRKGVQMIQYQILTLNSSNGQTPFITIFAYLNEAKSSREKQDLAMVIEEVLKQRIQGVKNEKGQWITPAFPKIIYALEEDNCKEGTEYWWLTELAAKCTAKRMVPDYISEKKMLEIKGYCFPSMGCRSFLSPWIDPETGRAKFYGRFNQGVCSLNLPYLALEAKKEGVDFFSKLDDYLDIVHEALQCRHARLLNTPVETSPMHWMYGALGRLPKGSTINKLLMDGYSSMSVGYAGLYEASMATLGVSHTTPEGKAFALAILKHMNQACEKWKDEEHIGYSIYGTPLESTTYKFAKALQKDFGVIPEVSDHSYVTNSYHVNVREKIDPFTKLKFESEFQELSSGGCISYIETANLQNNIPAVLEIIKFIYENIMYAELNTKSDYCQVCGSTDEIKIIEQKGKLIWQCPHCGNTDQNKMNVVRRTCGYLGSNFWNQGRTEEIRDRYVHLGNMELLDV